MGISTLAKTWIRNQFKTAFLTVEEVVKIGLKMPKVVIIDFTYVTKYVQDFDTGLDYIRKQVIPEFSGYFEQGCETVILVFDRFSPVNKYEEHQHRYSKFQAAIIPETVEDVMSLLSPKAQENATAALKKFIASNESTPASETRSASPWGFYGSDLTLNDIGKIEAREKKLKEEAMLTRMYESRDPAALLVITDLIMPSKDNWSSVIANKQLRRELMHYITCSLVRNEETASITYQSGVYKRKVGDGSGGNVGDFVHTGFTPPPSRFLCIHGGQTEKPTRAAALTQSYIPDDFLTVLSTETIAPLGGMSSGGMYKTKRTISRADEHHSPQILAKLGEGEVACMYYSLRHGWDDQLIVTGDGDTMFLALMASRFRLKEDMRQFRNTVHVLLRVPRKKAPGKRVTMPMTKKGVKFNQNTETYESVPESSSNNLYVDINSLYESIVYGAEFGKLADPIATFVAVMSLMKNDFIKTFAPGLGGGMDTSTETPWVLMPLLQNPLRYKNMIRILAPEPSLTAHSNPNVEVNTTFTNASYTPRWGSNSGGSATSYCPHGVLKDILTEKVVQYQADIDEDLFVKYVYECYYWKYKDLGDVRKSIARSRREAMSSQSSAPSRKRSSPKGHSNTTSYFPDQSSLEDIDFEFSRKQFDQEKKTAAKTTPKEKNVSETLAQDEEIRFCVEHIRAHLAKGKKKENQVMEDSEMVAFARKLKWLLSYWTNGYIGNCTYPNPCETYQGKSYYGWERTAENYHGCVSTADVSPPKPTSRNTWGKTNESQFIFGRASAKNAVVTSSSSNLKKTWSLDDWNVEDEEVHEEPITRGGMVVESEEEFLPGISFGTSSSIKLGQVQVDTTSPSEEKMDEEKEDEEESFRLLFPNRSNNMSVAVATRSNTDLLNLLLASTETEDILSMETEANSILPVEKSPSLAKVTSTETISPKQVKKQISKTSTESIAPPSPLIVATTKTTTKKRQREPSSIIQPTTTTVASKTIPTETVETITTVKKTPPLANKTPPPPATSAIINKPPKTTSTGRSSTGGPAKRRRLNVQQSSDKNKTEPPSDGKK